MVLTGADADLTALPVHLQHGADGAPYISSSTDFVVDPKTGFTNVGIRRLMLRGRTEAGVDLNSPSDLRAIYEASAAAGKPVPVAFVVGSHPIDHLAAVMRLPSDDLALMSALRGAPLPVVKCVTNDVRVPADAEWVLEGYIDERGHVEPEGPYGEFLGYYGAVKRNPVFHLTAITRRRDALFQTSTIGGKSLSRTDTAQLNGVRTEAMVWRALETAVREPVGVYATTSSGGMYTLRVAIRQRVPGEARNAIAACFGALTNVKHVFVVDPDIDIFSDEEMDWAFATRFQADRDLMVMTDMRAVPIDPSLMGSRTGAKAGFDLTWPPGAATKLEFQVPAPPTFKGKRFPSIEAALADGPKFFEDLMSAVGSRDGREIVRALEDLRAKTAIERDSEGRYSSRGSSGARLALEILRLHRRQIGIGRRADRTRTRTQPGRSMRVGPRHALLGQVVRPLAASHSPIVPKMHRVPVLVCRQNGAVPVCATAVCTIAQSAAIAIVAASGFMAQPRGLPLSDERQRGTLVPAMAPVGIDLG